MITLEPPRGMPDGDGKSAEAWRAWGLSCAGMGRFVRAAQAAVGLPGEADVLLAGDRTLRRLNREFRGKDKATDVLSFPSFCFAPAAAEFAGEHAGDLAISLETARRQAEEHGHSLRDEVRVLLLHGLLHLAGMDHENDDGEMAKREAALRAQLRLPSGLIARVGARGIGDTGEKQVPRFHPSGQRTSAGDPGSARNDKQKSKSNNEKQNRVERGRAKSQVSAR